MLRSRRTAIGLAVAVFVGWFISTQVSDVAVSSSLRTISMGTLSSYPGSHDLMAVDTRTGRVFVVTTMGLRVVDIRTGTILNTVLMH